MYTTARCVKQCCLIHTLRNPKHIKGSKERYLLGQNNNYITLCCVPTNSILLDLSRVWILFQSTDSHSCFRFSLSIFYTQPLYHSEMCKAVLSDHILHTNTQAVYHSKRCKAVLSDPYFTHKHPSTIPQQDVKQCCPIHILHTNTQALYHSKMCKAVLSDPHFTHKHPSTRLSGNM